MRRKKSTTGYPGLHGRDAPFEQNRRTDPSGAIYDLYRWKEEGGARKRGAFMIIRHPGELEFSGRKRAVKKGEMILIPPEDAHPAGPALDFWTISAGLIILLALLRLILLFY